MLWNDWFMLLDLVEKSCVMAVFAYGLLRSPFFRQLVEEKQQKRQQLILGLIFSLFSVYGIYNGLLVNGVLVALSRPGPILAGLLAGPALGTGVGTVTALVRYYHGGEHVIAASLASLAAGIFAGCYSKWRGGPVLSVREAVVFAAGFEVLARFSNLLIANQNMDIFLLEVKNQAVVFLPMVLGNSIMVAFFIFVVNVLREEHQIRSTQARMEGELALARQIQQSLVPALPPVFPLPPSFSLHAVLNPAREVGGDLYDFFFLDEKRFCFVIADVSGKGMAAALFMSATRTLFKAQADRESDTGDILERVNAELCRGNDASMFVTLFCGIMNMATGAIVYSNAGHNPPYLLRRNGNVEMLTARHGPALGVMEGRRYSSGRMEMCPGDSLLMYTDGVTEAMNECRELLGNQRLEAVLEKSSNLDPRQLLAAVTDRLDNFVGGAEQADDITLLALRFGKAPV